MGKAFRLSRKRKKIFKKKNLWAKYSYSKGITLCQNWEYYYFEKRVVVRSMFVIKNSPDYGHIDKDSGLWIRYKEPLINSYTIEDLKKWYKKNYPNDNEPIHYLNQNFIKWA